MDNMNRRRLQEMDRSNFGVIKGESDIRGWDVRTGSGRKIGEVEELIVDAQQKKVRYMVVDMKSNELELKSHRVLIPIGLAELDKEDDDVLLPSITVDQLRHLPTYDLNILDDITEKLICVVLGRDADADSSNQNKLTNNQQKDNHTADDDFYRHNYYDDDNLYKHRLQNAQQAQSAGDSDHGRGLRLKDRQNEENMYSDEEAKNRDRQWQLDEQRRMEMVRNRRQSYEGRRGRSDQSDYSDDYNR